jgi:hypothetical protein
MQVGEPASTPPPPAPPPPPPPPCTLTTETVATQPSNRARTKIGVGEEVELTVSGGSATWSVSAGGRLSGTSGASVTFTAGDRAASATITAQTPTSTCAITFTIVEPSGVSMTRYPGTGIKHTINRPNVGIQTAIYFLPDDVCFYRLEYHEVDVPCACTGVYTPFNGVGHDPHPATLSLSQDVVAGHGTKCNAMDSVYSGDPGTPPPFAPGTELFPIPYEYRVIGGGWHRFATVNQLCALAGTNLTASKGGANGATTVAAATSAY